MSINANSSLKLLMYLIGVVAVITGANIVIQGVSGIPDSGLIVQASVDNELRFMAVFWVAFGCFAALQAKAPCENIQNIRLIAGTFFVSGLARLLSLIQVGQPIPLFIGVMLLELLLPFVIFALVKKVSTQTSSA